MDLVIHSLRVVHLGKYYPPASGGIESHTQTLARAQTALGAKVAVAVVNHANGNGRDVTFNRIARTQTTEDYDGLIRVCRAGRFANIAKFDITPGLASLLAHVRRDFRPDIWHLHTPNITMMLAALLDRGIRPLVVTHHSDIVRQKLLRHFVRPLENAICKLSEVLLSDSPTYANGSALLTKYASKVTSLPLGIDLSPYQYPTPSVLQITERLRQGLPGPIWLSVGRLIYYKALEVALTALQDVPGTLVIIGTGPMEAEWKKLAINLGVANRVRWLGRASQEELLGAYRAATALWFPSNARSEGFGLVQVEAMASGCPVINAALPDSGVTWVCRHEQEGLTVPLNDPIALGAMAKRLIAEPNLRKRLSTAGCVRANAEFDWLVMGRRSLEIYRQVRAK